MENKFHNSKFSYLENDHQILLIVYYTMNRFEFVEKILTKLNRFKHS